MRDHLDIALPRIAPIGTIEATSRIRCWVELKPDQFVALRALPAERLGVLSASQQGVVELVSSDGVEICVRFGEVRAQYKREELLYVVGQSTRT